MRKPLLPLILALGLTACSVPVTPPRPAATPVATASPTAPAVQRPPVIPSFPSQGAIPTPDPNAAELSKRLVSEKPMLAPGAAVPGSTADSVSADAKPAKPGLVLPAPVPNEPGTLTAGLWSDLNNWSFWQDLLAQPEWDGMPGLWGLNTLQRVQVKLEGPDGPLADVPVELRDQDQVIFQARTHAGGVAELFINPLQAVEKPDLTTQQLSTSRYQIRVQTGGETLTRDFEPAAANGLTTLSLKATTQPEPLVQADLMLVVDTTGSMGDELEYLKTELKNVSAQILAQSRPDLKLRLSANFYRDRGDEYVVRPFPFTSSSDEVSQQLAAQSANGGGDFPEAVDYALQDAIEEHAWSPTARARLLFLVLDAPPHQEPQTLNRLRTSLLRAAARGIRIIPVASSGIDKETEFLLRMLAIVSGGRYLFLTDDSGVGQSHLKPTIGQFSVEKLNALMVRTARAYIAGDLP